MTVSRVVTLVLVLTLAGGIVGLCFGGLIGSLMPEYYISIFHTHDPVQFGFGAGLSQGATMGFVLGLLIVAIQAFGKPKPKE